MEEKTEKHSKQVRFYAGIDWGREEHVVVVTDQEGVVVAELSITHTGEGISKLAARLEELAGAMEHCLIALEMPHGPLVEALLDRGARIYAINPKQLDRFRDRHNVAGAKDDRRDAFVLATSLRTDTHLFRELAGESAHIKEIRVLSRLHSELTEDISRLTSRMAEQLWRYFPALLTVAKGDLDHPWIHELWILVPLPALALKVRPSQVQRILHRYRIQRIKADEVLTALRAEPISVAPGTATSARRYLETLFERAALARKQLTRCRADIDATFESLPGDAEAPPGQKSEQRDARIVRSLPGVGPILHATLLAEAHEPLARREYDKLRALCGAAPVTLATGSRTREGKKVDGRKVVLMRRACNERLRNALFWMARVAAQHEPRSAAKYKALRARGISDAQALRTIGDRLLKVICAMLETATPYDREKRSAAAAA
jgi:transposase